MNVLIFGASGQIGSYLSEHFIAQGSSVYNASRTRGLFTPAASKFVPFDAFDKNDVLALLTRLKPDAVINLLSMSSVYECSKNPEASKHLNTNFVPNLIIAISRYEENLGLPIRFLQASSSEMYSGYPPETLISESTFLKPLTIYGEHKSIAHLATLERNKTAGNAQAVILFNHESPRRSKGFVSQKITNGLVEIKYKNAGKILLGNIHSRRDWGYADDYALGILKLVQDRNLESVVLASGELHSVNEFILEGAEYLEIDNIVRRIEVDPNLLRKKENDGLIGDSSRAKQYLQWTRTKIFRDLVHSMIDSETKRQKIG